MSLNTQIALVRARLNLGSRLSESVLGLPDFNRVAKIPGKPFAVVNKKVSRKALMKSIELANNAKILGWGRAEIGSEGRKASGFYFQATDGSAKGVVRNAGGVVYHLPKLGRDMFFATNTRLGLQEMGYSSDPDLIEMGPDAGKGEKGCPPGQRMVFGKCQPTKHAKLRAKFKAFKAKPKQKFGRLTTSLESKSTKPMPPLHKWPLKIEKGHTVYTLGKFRVVEKGEPAGSGLYEYELFSQGKSAGKFNNQREVVAKAQALRGM